MSEQSTGGNKLVTLEMGRFFASVGVLFYHYTEVVRNFDGSLVMGGLLDIGAAGVRYFFVLSGFIIYYIHRKDIGRPEMVAPFALKRAIRLLPMFWIISLPMLIGFMIVPSLAEERSISAMGLVADFLLLPHSDSVLSISWTLRHEVVFYFLFALAIFFGRWALALVAIWIGIGLIGTAWPLNQSMLGSYSIVMGAVNLGFGLGILCAVLLNRRTVGSPAVWCGLGVVLVFGVGLLGWYLGRGDGERGDVLGAYGTVAQLVGSAFLIYGLVSLEQRGWRMAAPNVWRVLGGSSYALYLVHQPLASVLLRVFKPFAALPPMAVFLILSAAAVVVALILHLTIERWILARLAPLARRPFKPAPAA